MGVPSTPSLQHILGLGERTHADDSSASSCKTGKANRKKESFYSTADRPRLLDSSTAWMTYEKGMPNHLRYDPRI
jgi:hypothetical protein